MAEQRPVLTPADRNCASAYAAGAAIGKAEHHGAERMIRLVTRLPPCSLMAVP